MEGIETTRPLWMLWWFFPFEGWFGIGSVAVGLAALFGLIYLVPFPDRSPRRRWHERPVAMGVAAVLLLALIAISVYVWINNPHGH